MTFKEFREFFKFKLNKRIDHAKAFWNLFLFLSKLIRKLSAKVFSIMLSSALMFGSVKLKVKANFELIVSNEFTAEVVKVMTMPRTSSAR